MIFANSLRFLHTSKYLNDSALIFDHVAVIFATRVEICIIFQQGRAVLGNLGIWTPGPLSKKEDTKKTSENIAQVDSPNEK